MISAKIITIGDEILIGQIIDTNSTFILKELMISNIYLKNSIKIYMERINADF